MPLLADFWDRHRAEKGRFEILGFHEPSVDSPETLDAKWKGRKLPFPQLFDAAGVTIREYGIDEYPTLVLVDPEGKVVQVGNEALLPDLLERLEAELRKP